MINKDGLQVEISDGEKFIFDECTENIRKYSGELKTVVDIGAHVGCFSLYAAKLGAERVFAFEACPRNYYRLVENIVRNDMQGIIIPINMAAYREKYQTIPMQKAGMNDGQYGVMNPDANNVGFDVPTFDGDLIYCIAKDIDYMKIDIEGAEYDFLTNSAMYSVLSNVNFLELELHGTSYDWFDKSKIKSKHMQVDDPMTELASLLIGFGFNDRSLEESKNGDNLKIVSKNNRRSYDD